MYYTFLLLSDVNLFTLSRGPSGDRISVRVRLFYPLSRTSLHTAAPRTFQDREPRLLYTNGSRQRAKQDSIRQCVSRPGVAGHSDPHVQLRWELSLDSVGNDSRHSVGLALLLSVTFFTHWQTEYCLLSPLQIPSFSRGRWIGKFPPRPRAKTWQTASWWNISSETYVVL